MEVLRQSGSPKDTEHHRTCQQQAWRDVPAALGRVPRCRCLQWGPGSIAPWTPGSHCGSLVGRSTHKRAEAPCSWSGSGHQGTCWHCYRAGTVPCTGWASAAVGAALLCLSPTQHATTSCADVPAWRSLPAAAPSPPAAGRCHAQPRAGCHAAGGSPGQGRGILLRHSSHH